MDNASLQYCQSYDASRQGAQSAEGYASMQVYQQKLQAESSIRIAS